MEDVRSFLVQFSVFSNLFMQAQLLKAINSPTLEAMRTSKEILLNELGVVFRSKKKATDETDAALVATEGTVDGGTFRFPAAHFSEWLLQNDDVAHRTEIREYRKTKAWHAQHHFLRR